VGGGGVRSFAFFVTAKVSLMTVKWRWYAGNDRARLGRVHEKARFAACFHADRLIKSHTPDTNSLARAIHSFQTAYDNVKYAAPALIQ
jgi:hypothetical protein